MLCWEIVIASLCILVPGSEPSFRGCRLLRAADVVVRVVGACAWWVSAVRVGATTEVVAVAKPGS